MIQDTSTMDRPVAGRARWTRTLLRVGLPAGIALVAVLALAPAFSRWMSTEQTVSLTRLRLGEVARGDLQRDVSVQGRIVAAYHPTLFSPDKGTVRLLVRAGEVVEAGQPLATVHSPDLDSRRQQERSRLRSMETDLERQRIQVDQTLLAGQQQVDLAAVRLEAAQRAMRRAERSREEGILNEVEYEKAIDDQRLAELELAHARQDLAFERERLEFELHSGELGLERQRMVVADLDRQVDELTVRAPVTGLVSRLDVAERDAVNPGQPLVTVVDLSAFEVEILVPESYADQIGPGVAAVVEYDGRQWPAEVRTMAPEVEGSQVRGTAAFAGEPPAGLKQNQRVSTRLILEQRTGVLKVPRGPFLESGGGREVFVVDGDVAQRRRVEIGAVSVDEVEIVSGLEPGERIIISDVSRFGDARRLLVNR